MSESDKWVQDMTRAVNETAKQIHLLLSPLVDAATTALREVPALQFYLDEAERNAGSSQP